MSDQLSDDLAHALRERGARYVVGTTGQPIAVLLTVEEYEHSGDGASLHPTTAAWPQQS